MRASTSARERAILADMEEAHTETFEEFWPRYVRAHTNKTNRMLHFAGTSLAMACIAGALVTRRARWLLLAPVVGYGLPWFGHFVLEKNVPATFSRPIYSLRADLRMWKKILDGSMDAEVERVLASDEDVADRASGERVAEPAHVANGAVN